jgi:8-oxo-dGTP diphosphatase
VGVSREYPARPVVGVGAVILASRHEARAVGWAGLDGGTGVVLVRRLFEPLAGRWSLPGGGLEVGETLEAGVAREVAEETGLTVDVGPIVEVFDRILLDAAGRVQYHFVLIDYVCRPRHGRLRAGSDVGEVTIADTARLESYEMTEKALDVIAKAARHAV